MLGKVIGIAEQVSSIALLPVSLVSLMNSVSRRCFVSAALVILTFSEALHSREDSQF